MKAYTQPQLSRKLGIGLNCLRYYVSSGDLPYALQDGKPVFKEHDVKRFQQEHPDIGMTREERRKLHDSRCGRGSFESIVRKLNSGDYRSYSSIAREEDVTVYTVSQIAVRETPEGAQTGFERRYSMIMEERWEELQQHPIFGPFYDTASCYLSPERVKPVPRSSGRENFRKDSALIDGRSIRVSASSRHSTSGRDYFISVPQDGTEFLFAFLLDDEQTPDQTSSFLFAPTDRLPRWLQFRLYKESKYAPYFNNFNSLKRSKLSIEELRKRFDVAYGKGSIELLHELLGNPAIEYSKVGTAFDVGREIPRQWQYTYFPDEAVRFVRRRANYKKSHRAKIIKLRMSNKAVKSVVYKHFSKIVADVPGARFELLPAAGINVKMGDKTIALRKATDRHNGQFALRPPAGEFDAVWYHMDEDNYIAVPRRRIGSKQTTFSDSELSPYYMYKNNPDALL